MNAYDKQITFQALKQAASELRGRANADPLQQSASLLEDAIAQLDRFEDEVERGQALREENNRVQNQVQVAQAHLAAVNQEIQNLESKIERLKVDAAHYESLKKDSMIKTIADNQLGV